MRVVRAPLQFDVSTDVVVVGAGAAGLIAALRVASAGVSVLVAERDSKPAGSTSLSSGFVPAAATRYQLRQGIVGDSESDFAADIQAKAKDRALPELVDLAVGNIAEALHWLDDNCGIEWLVLDDFLYPGHSSYRMHAVQAKTGLALHAQLYNAAARADIPLVTGARVNCLYTDEDDCICGVALLRDDKREETIACQVVVLACNGYGGNAELVQQHIPQIAAGPYFGHAGNTGDAVLFARALDAKLEHLSGYQGHGSVAQPHGILITWAVIMRGGIQVNQRGQRFADESQGYSEQAVQVLQQPGGVAWNIYDKTIHDFALSFDDYRRAVEVGAVVEAASIVQLAQRCGLPRDALTQTLYSIDSSRNKKIDCPYGRDFSKHDAFDGRWCAVKVTGALFHTQGGIVVDEHGRVRRIDGSLIDNLYAVGGAACGVSGPDVSGYLSGNGLLTAFAFAYVAGGHAAKTIKSNG